jgi:hypothetical protein
LGVALLSTIFISREHHLLSAGVQESAAALGGYRLAFAASSIFALLGALYAFFMIHDEDAAATMVPR